MTHKVVWCVSICPDKETCESRVMSKCKRYGCYLFDTASDLWFDGTAWTPDSTAAKRYGSEYDAENEAFREYRRQRLVVAELSEKFGE